MLSWLKLDPRYLREAGIHAACPGCLELPDAASEANTPSGPLRTARQPPRA